MNKSVHHTKPKQNKTGNRGATTLSWISGAIFIFGLAIMAGIYWEKNVSISEVRFTGQYFTSEDDLAAAFEAPVGVHPDSVRYFEVMEAVNALPFVKNSGVRVDARGRMTVEVTEREPLAILIEGSKRIYIDEDGVKMPLSFEKAVNVPLLHGFTVEPQSEPLTGKEFESVRNFLNAAKRNNFGWITISEIAYDREEGVVALSHDNGVKLLFGYGNYDQKMRYWEAFYTEVIREKGIGRFASVDMRYRNQIVTREI